MKNGFLLAASVMAFALLVSLGASGCSTHPKNVTALNLSGEVYAFNTNLVDSIKVNSSNDEAIKNLFDSSKSVCIIFQDSDEDNGYFAVISYNIVFKLTRYYSNLGEAKSFTACNLSNLSSDATIELRGPATGANQNSVMLDENNVIVQGTTSKDMEKAGDKLLLIVFGIKKL